MPVCGNYLFFELPKKIVLNPKDGKGDAACKKLAEAHSIGDTACPRDHQMTNA